MSVRDPSYPIGHAVGSDVSCVQIVSISMYWYVLVCIGNHVLYLPRIILDDDMGVSPVR